MFSKFSEEAQKILLNAKKEMAALKHPYVGSEHLLLAILSDKDGEVTQKINEYGINYDMFKKEVLKIIGKGNISNDWFLYTPLLKRIIENATIDARENKDKEVTILHLFLSLLEEGDGVAIRILMGMNIDIDELYEEFNNNTGNCLAGGSHCEYVDFRRRRYVAGCCIGFSQGGNGSNF